MNYLPLIGTATAVLIAIVTAWISTKIEIAKLQVKVLEIEKNFEHERNLNATEFRRVENNFSKVHAGIQDIQLALKDKENRK